MRKILTTSFLADKILQLFSDEQNNNFLTPKLGVITSADGLCLTRVSESRWNCVESRRNKYYRIFLMTH